MTNDELDTLLRTALDVLARSSPGSPERTLAELAVRLAGEARTVEAAVAAEREACLEEARFVMARICDGWPGASKGGMFDTAEEIVDRIRARGPKPPPRN